MKGISVRANGSHLVPCGRGGKRTTRTFPRGPEGLRMAKEFLAQEQARKILGIPAASMSLPTYSLGSQVTVADIAQPYLDLKRAQGRSLGWRKEMRSLLQNHFLPEFGHRLLSSIRQSEVLTFIDRTFGQRSKATQDRYTSYFRSYMSYAVAEGHITANPLAKFGKKREKPRAGLLTLADLKKIKDNAALHLAQAIDVVWATGVRPGRSELFALRFEHVDFDAKEIVVYAPKTKTVRRIPLRDEFLEKLKVLQEQHKSGFLVEYNGRQMVKFRRAFRTAHRKAGIPYPAVFYDVRHLFATTAVAFGDIAAVSDMMGHSQISTTVNNYVHLRADSKRRVVEQMPSLG